MVRASVIEGPSGCLKMAKFYSVVIFVAAAVGLVLAVTDEEKNTIRADLEPLQSSCGDEFGISKEDVLASKKEKIANLNPCFYACVLKKIGILNDQGLFEPAASKAMHKKYIHNQDDRKELDAITDTCTSANDQAVSDGIRGCERAKALVQCFIDNMANFPLMSV